MFKKFLPKEKKFLELMTEHSKSILEGATLLNEMLVKFENISEYATKIRMIEHKCDEITHTVVHELNETFVTPIDREDLFALVDSLDNVADSLDNIANRIFLYKIKAPIQFGPQLSEIILSQAKIIVGVVQSLIENKKTFDELVKLRKLESDGDVIFYQALTQLFETEKDPIELIKKKEIIEILEKAIDRCQTVSIVVESILIKNV
jgi:uncharacterized protein